MEKGVAERRAWSWGPTTWQPAGDQGSSSAHSPRPPRADRHTGNKDEALVLPGDSNSCANPKHRMEGRKGGFLQRVPGVGFGGRRQAQSLLVGTQEA